MLGVTRRASSSSLDCLELERSASSKLPKSDPLSVYEITLEKLRIGSRRAFRPPIQDLAKEGEQVSVSSCCGNRSAESSKPMEEDLTD